MERTVLPSLGSILLVIALFFPWWSATAKLPDGMATAQLTLYSFQFESARFTCTTSLFFYSYGNCPLLGSVSGDASLAFYIFWALFFLAISICLGFACTISVVKRYDSEARLLANLSPLLSAASALSFVAALSTAGLRFVSGNALYGSSDILRWSASYGFVISIASTLVLLVNAYRARQAT